MSNELHNEIMMDETLDPGFEPELSPEQNTPEVEPVDVPTDIPVSPAQTSTEPEQPAGDELVKPAEKEVDEEPKPTEQALEQIKKLQDQVNALHRRLAKSNRPAVKVPDPVDESTAPKIEDFTTIEDFEKAKSDWDVDRRIAEGIRKATQVDPALEKKEERQQAANEMRDRAATKYTDYVEVITKETTPLTLEMFDAAREIESEKIKPEDVLYYLGKNPTEAAQLSRISPYQLGREIGKIVTKLEAAVSKSPPKTIKTVSDAPAPIKPTDSTVIITKDPDKMTQAEYEAWRMGGSKG